MRSRPDLYLNTQFVSSLLIRYHIDVTGIKALKSINLILKNPFVSFGYKATDAFALSNESAFKVQDQSDYCHANSGNAKYPTLVISFTNCWLKK